MRSVALSEAKDRLSEFVAAAEAGDEIVITRHGKARARLVAIDDHDGRLRRQRTVLAELAEWRENQPSTGITLDEIVGWVREDRNA